MKTHTEKIKEEIEELRSKLENVSLDKLPLIDFPKINRYFALLLKEAQLKEAERHDQIIKKIKEEVDKLIIPSDPLVKLDIHDFINKIDQEGE